jgi:ATP-dependent RNA helicase DHX57
MGGVKNRDAKRTAAKVFSSGGGGGAKGPSVLDKRGQEEKCPHCDRTFKQSGRLKDHIAKQHAAEGGGDGQEASTSAADAAGPSGSGSGRPPLARPGSSGALGAAGAAASKPAGSRPGTSGSGSAAGAAASGAPREKVMMDVGARGGFFDEKSPKLLLQEWCTRAKRPQPRYVAQSGSRGPNGPPPGQYGCKVVLPDPKGVAERDLVVWLDASLAAPDADEAAQRGAVAALHAVQGDRALDYVLPARYRVVWRELGDKVGG